MSLTEDQAEQLGRKDAAAFYETLPSWARRVLAEIKFGAAFLNIVEPEGFAVPSADGHDDIDDDDDLWDAYADGVAFELDTIATPPPDPYRSFCKHCQRVVTSRDGVWVDEAATGDDAVWRETCGAHDTREANHEPGGRPPTAA